MNKKNSYLTTYTSIRNLGNFILLISILSFSVSCDESTQREEKKISRKVNKTNDSKPAAVSPSKNNSVEFLKAYADTSNTDEVIIQTSFGNIVIQLYRNTPLHRASFLNLTRHRYFDDTWFHRVSKGHVIQAGNTDERSTQQKRREIGDYTIPAEMGVANYHERGAVAAVRSYDNNPEKRSEPFEFYIVLGQKYSLAQLDAMAVQYGRTFNSAQKKIYQQSGGSPHLDGEHTVFGKVIEGMEVVQKINEVQTDEGEWPMVNIPIQVKIAN